MSEIVFPLVGTVFVVAVVLPAAALLAKAALLLLERTGGGGPLHGLNLRYLVLAGSSLLPLGWFLSASLHQAESGRSVLACLLAHEPAELCLEPGLFGLFLTLTTLALAGPLLRNALLGPKLLESATPGSAAEAAQQRVRRLIEQFNELHILRGRVHMTRDSDQALATYGLLSRKVVVDEGFATAVSDEALRSALAHEAEHVHAFDPLRYFALRLALAINPLGRWLLTPHVARWYGAREAHCDREAVMRGAAPLPLAQALLRAARGPARAGQWANQSGAGLGVRDDGVLQLRVRLLLAFSERPPAHCCPRGRVALPAALLLFSTALALPHQAGTGALDAIHSGAEQLVHQLRF